MKSRKWWQRLRATSVAAVASILTMMICGTQPVRGGDGEGPDCNMNGKPDAEDLTTNTRATRLFFDDFERDKIDDRWIMTGLWRSDKTECLEEAPPEQDPPSDYRAAYNRDKDHCDYNIGARTVGVLEMITSVTIPALGGELVWWNWIETEGVAGVDVWRVQISDDDGETWRTVYDGKGESAPFWQELSVPLYDFRNKKIKVRFVFDSKDEFENGFLGWFIDDVAIYGADKFSNDCNGNGIPDECEPDCNCNGIPDDCDLRDETSVDCNANGLPDECDANDCVTTMTPVYTPFDAEQPPAEFDFRDSDTTRARSKIRMDFYGNGSFGLNFNHRIDVYIGTPRSIQVGSVLIRMGSGPCGSGMKPFLLNETVFNNNSHYFKFVPGPNIAPRCESSYLQVGISYLTPNPEKDCNGNNIPDSCDLASGASKDCNGNGVPDECDIAAEVSSDCNGNGVPDECDIEEGTSTDCNSNTVLDECDVARGDSLDCNENDYPDECDLAEDISPDCNYNEVPDECDIAARVSQDTQPDGIPDECQIEQETPPCSDDLTAQEFWFDDFENPAVERWTTTTDFGTCTWFYPPPPSGQAPYSGTLNAWGGRWSQPSDSSLEMTEYVSLPTTPPIFLLFRHYYEFESYPANYDGGVVEYLTDEAGTTWTDLGPYLDVNGYRGNIALNYHNPLAGREAFVGSSLGYIESRADLTTFAGKRIKIRFRAGTDWATPSMGWFIDDVRFVTCSYEVDENPPEDFSQPPLGWVQMSRMPSTGDFTQLVYDEENGALGVHVAASSSRYRIGGWFTDDANRLPYGYVGPNRIVRAKFYVYASGQANPAQLNTIPNFRLRVANRFAVNSMLEVNSHVNASPGDEPVLLDVRPSTDPGNPSLYRVDFDPVDVPQLIMNPWSESILRGFEAYCLDPQDNGGIYLTESSMGVYPRSWLTPSTAGLAWLKTYEPAPPSPGDFAFSNPETNVEQVSIKITGDGTIPAYNYDFVPLVWADGNGLSLDSTDYDNYFDGYHIGVVQVDLGPGPRPQRVRVEPGKQYMVRFHVTSTQQSNLNPQLRLRVRTLRFGWVQKYEVGGAWAINTPQHVALCSQALPGIGCMNPDKIGTEKGGWYTVILHSPLNPEIRPDVPGSLCEKMPSLCAQPGPGVDAPSLRDLKVGVDLIDTMSTSIYKDLEAGNFTVDRIEIFSFNTIPD